jgi:hypothetical protein
MTILEIRDEIKKFLEFNGNESTTYQKKQSEGKSLQP